MRRCIAAVVKPKNLSNIASGVRDQKRGGVVIALHLACYAT